MKLFLQTLPSWSPQYFQQVRNTTECEDCFRCWADEVEYEVIQRVIATDTLAVAHPFGIAGEGFLPHRVGTIGFQPSWKINVSFGQPLIYQGEAPRFVVQGGKRYYQIVCRDAGYSDLLHLGDAIFCLLCFWRNS